MNFLRGLWRLLFLISHLGLSPLLALLFWPYDGLQMKPFQWRLLHWWYRILLRGLGVSFRVDGEPYSGTALIVANHISWLDIPLLGQAVRGGFIAKQEIRRWPLVGRLSLIVGTLFIQRGGPNAASEVNRQMASHLAAGRSVILFPEATTSDGLGVKAFHARLFEAAVAEGVMLQPVAIYFGVDSVAPFIGDDQILSHVWRLLGARGVTATVVFLPPLPATAPRKPLANLCRSLILEQIERLSVG